MEVFPTQMNCGVYVQILSLLHADNMYSSICNNAILFVATNILQTYDEDQFNSADIPKHHLMY